MRLALLVAAVSAVLPVSAAAAQAAAVFGGPSRQDVSLDQVEAPIPVALLLSASPVALGMGNVGVVSRDADVLFYNPGMLTQASGLTGSMQRFGSVGTAGSFASVESVGSYTIGLGARFVDWSSAESQYGAALAPGTGVFSRDGDTRASSLALTAGAARGLGPVRIGVAATYLRESFRFDRDESLLVDVGAAMRLGPANLGVAVQHIGTRVVLPGSRGVAPWLVTVGYGNSPLPVSTFFDVNPVGQVSVDSEGAVLGALGGELIYVPLDGLRFIWRLGVRSPRDAAESLFTTGLGLSLDRVSLDYALDPYRQGAAAHRLGIRIR